MTLYRYGWMAWIWRGFAALGILAAILLLTFSVRFESWAFLAMALPLALPSTLLPWMVAADIKLADPDHIVVTNLLFIRRHIRISSLGRPRLRLEAQAMFRMIPAPRAWIPVQRGLPIYVDLLAEIPDRGAFQSVFKVPR